MASYDTKIAADTSSPNPAESPSIRAPETVTRTSGLERETLFQFTVYDFIQEGVSYFDDGISRAGRISRPSKMMEVD